MFELTYDRRGFPEYHCPYCTYLTLTVKGMQEHVGKKHEKREGVM